MSKPMTIDHRMRLAKCLKAQQPLQELQPVRTDHLIQVCIELTRVCEWTEEPESGYWEGPCGVAWEFMSDGPKENGCNYCPNCAGIVEVKE